MLGLTESLIAISAIIMTGRFAGRIPAMMLTAVAAAGAAIIMPPFASWEVESTTDVLTVVFQTIIGLVVAYKLPSKDQREHRPIASSFSERPKEPGHSLITIVHGITKRDVDLAAGSRDIEVYGELHGSVGISTDELDQVVSDTIRIALSDPTTKRVAIYTGRRPSVDQISLVAQYGPPMSLPRTRMLGLHENHRALHMQGWPANCSAVTFDNGFEKTYLISIREN
jgi:hypothetical protein